jgi:hypothetical protein
MISIIFFISVIYVLFSKFEKSYPAYMMLCFGFAQFSEMISLHINNLYIELSFVAILIFLFKSFRYIKLEKFDGLLIFVFVTTGIHMAVGAWTDNSGIIDIYKQYKIFFIELVVIITIIYCRRFGIHQLLKWLNRGCYIHIFMNIFTVIVLRSFQPFHQPTIGLAVAIILFLNRPEIRFKKTNYIRNIFNLFLVVLPLLGMARGGILAVCIFFIFTIRMKPANIFLVVFISAAAIFAADTVMEKYKYSNIIFRHRGADNLTEILQDTFQSEETGGLRVLRWYLMIESFKKNVWMGIGFAKEDVYDLYSKGGLGERTLSSVWQAHNFYFALLGGGGLLVFMPHFLMHLIAFYKSIGDLISRKRSFIRTFRGFLILEVIVINMTNCYYVFYWSGSIMWMCFGIAWYLIVKNPDDSEWEKYKEIGRRKGKQTLLGLARGGKSLSIATARN